MYPQYYFYDSNKCAYINYSQSELLTLVTNQMQHEIKFSSNKEQINKLKDDIDFLQNSENNKNDQIEIALAYLDKNNQLKKVL